MASVHDVIVLGGGVNSLAASAVLARAGQKVLLLERRPVLGGVLALEETWPGCPVPHGLHPFGGLVPSVAEAVGIASAALPEKVEATEVAVGHGDDLFRLSRDPVRMAKELERTSVADARRFPDFAARTGRQAAMFGELLDRSPPPSRRPPAGEALDWLRIGWKLRGMGEVDLAEFLRVLPQPVEDLLNDEFESEWFKAALAAPACFAAELGPMSAGTGMRFLHHQALAQGPTCIVDGAVHGKAGELVRLLEEAAGKAGAELRRDTEVTSIQLADGGVKAVVTAAGEELACRHVVSGLDPGCTLLDLVGVSDLAPGLLRDASAYRSRGSTAKVHFVVDRVPAFFEARDGRPAAAFAWFGEGLEHLERVHDAHKYGRPAETPVLDVCIPSLLDPLMGELGKYVVSVLVETVVEDSTDAADALGRQVAAILARHDGGFTDSILEREVLLPAELGRRVGLSGGHLHQGDVTLDQWFLLRPFPSCARYRTPIRGLYLCGAGTHPGGPSGGRSGVIAAREVLRDARRARA